MTDGNLSTKLYVKREDLEFRIANFPYICSKIPESPAYAIYISQLKRYVIAILMVYFIEREGGGGARTKKLVLIKVIGLKNLRSTFESFMVNTIIYYNITILLFHSFCVT